MDLTEGSYKIKELYIKNNGKVFQDFKINFTSDGITPLPVIVIAGKNGTGKTTLLEYLANLSININDYIDIYTVKKPDGIEAFEEDDLIIDNFKIIDGMSGTRVITKEYKKHIEYLPVYASRINDIKEFILDRHRKRSRELDSISKATKEIGDFIKDIFKGMDLSFSLVDVDDTVRDNEKVIFKNKNGKNFDIENLSTGEKTLLSKVLYLYFKDIKNQIILIDEPELSLHPDWQNRVLNLYKDFAEKNNCQIIVATHSPHIIGSAKPEYIRVLQELDGKIEVLKYSQSYGLKFSQILTEIMGVEYLRTPAVAKKMNIVKNMIVKDEYDSDEFKSHWNELEEMLGKKYLDLKLLKLEIASRRKNVSDNQN